MVGKAEDMETHAGTKLATTSHTQIEPERLAYARREHGSPLAVAVLGCRTLPLEPKWLRMSLG